MITEIIIKKIFTGECQKKRKRKRMNNEIFQNPHYILLLVGY